MKSITLLSLLAAGTVLGGEPIYDKSPAVMPATPSLYNWFVGGTFGYLLDNDEEMYTGHIGVDLPNQLGGWDQAIYLEIGYAEFGECESYFSEPSYPDPQGIAGGKSPDYYYDLDEYLYYYGNQDTRICFDLEMIPITLNYKLEKQISPALNAYVGVGAGVALFDAEVKVSGSSFDDDDDDTVFYAQLFAGILYNVSQTFEIYAGARAIYFDEPEFTLFGSSVDSDDLDVENTDILIEAGARINF